MTQNQCELCKDRPCVCPLGMYVNLTYDAKREIEEWEERRKQTALECISLMRNMWKNPEKIDTSHEHAQETDQFSDVSKMVSGDDFVRTGAGQNIDPEYVKMVAGISEDLIGIGASPVPNSYIKIVPDDHKWIKCSERMPPESKDVWVFDGEEVCIDSWLGKYWDIHYSVSDVTHWTEIKLPEPPNL